MREVAYWGEHTAVKTIAVSTLDRERENILKAIGFGLAVAPSQAATVWPATRHLIITFAPYMERRGLWDSWHSLLERAIAAAQQVADVAGEITLTALLARLSQRQSRGADVVAYYRRVIRLARRTDNRFELARACSNLGFYYGEHEQWWRSEVLGCYALTLFEALNSQHGRAHTHNHLGTLYTRQKRWAEAETHLQQACNFWRAIGDEHSLTAFGLLNLGMLYVDQKKPEEALTWLEDAYHRAEALGETAMVGYILQNMAIAYRQKGKLVKAEDLARQAEQIFHKHHDVLLLAYTWHNIGIIYTQGGQTAKADEYIGRALQLYRQLGNHYGEERLLEELKELESVDVALQVIGHYIETTSTGQ
ncbi:MAG: tetratricopeptide repeat protein [Caldilinea sp. CFX5]|nr:tetratricopeptide repeat protein [Caldilinea sp. CFX5]